jgi:subtilisin family serine protease
MSIHVKIFAVLSLGLIAFLYGWQGTGADTVYADVPAVHPVSIPDIADETTPTGKSNSSAFTGITDSQLTPGYTASSVENWPLNAIHKTQVNSIAVRAPVLVAVLIPDRRSHEELQGKVVSEVCFVDGCNANDVLGHGTFIAGIIAADDSNDAASPVCPRTATC